MPQLLPRDAFQGEVLEGLNEAKKRAAAAEATAVETRNELQLIGNDSRERDQLVVKQLAQLQELLGSSRDSEEWREQANRLNIDPDLNETERKRLAIKMTKKLVDASKAILLASEPHSEELTQEMKDAIMNLKDALLTKDFGRAIQIIDEMPVRPEPAEMLKPSSPPSAPTGLRVIGG